MIREEEKQEKARELAIKYCKDIDPHGKEVYNIGCAIACCEMADWADQNPRKGLWDAEKVCKYLEEHAGNYITLENDEEGELQTVFYQRQLIKDLRKAMEN